MPTTMTPSGLRACNELNEPIVGNVFGPPGKRAIQCPSCCATMYLPRGPFRGQRFQCGACKDTCEVYWNAGLRSWG